MKFHITERVKVISGFYSTFKGRILSVIENKDGSIFYEVNLKIRDNEEKVKIQENELKATKWIV